MFLHKPIYETLSFDYKKFKKKGIPLVNTVVIVNVGSDTKTRRQRNKILFSQGYMSV